MKTKLKIIFNGISGSYSQIFFSDNRVFAIILFLITFIDYGAGFCGLITVIMSNSFAYWLGYDRHKIEKGLYGFNSLLVGLGIGIYFQVPDLIGLSSFVFLWLLVLYVSMLVEDRRLGNLIIAVCFVIAFGIWRLLNVPDSSYLVLVIVMLASVFTLFISVSNEGILGKYGLPFLSIPFLIVMWVIMLATRNFEALGLSARGIYTLNDMYILGGQDLIDVYAWWNFLGIVESLRIYFISLGAIFFQYNVLAGILIAIGILYYSRIAFSLSLIGFYSAYFFYDILGANLTDLSYTYIGFNYILTSIAIGGFFLIPSYKSYIWTILLIPVVALITVSMNMIFSYFQLSIYSLPFNLIVLLFLYVLKLRIDYRKGPTEATIQQNTPEKNLYAYLNHKIRFGDHKLVPVSLPFWGEWIVSQAHNGEYTHKDKWRHAWDFVIADSDGNNFKEAGTSPEHYYCYNKAVIAPADGMIEAVEDGIRDNRIGEVNLLQNWGNTIIIKHYDGLYSKLSHLKAGSIKVVKGESVKKGDILGNVGNSGRSPEPHLHFQLQETPYIGSETLDYPIGYYIKHHDNKFVLNEFKRPGKNDLISNIKTNPLLKNAFKFIPGQIIKLRIDDNSEVEWKVMIDYYNNTYLQCSRTNSFAFYYNDDQMHYFKSFKGDKNSLLYHFFLAAYKIQFGYYQGIELEDKLPVNIIFRPYRLFLQDFIAPFYLYLKAFYRIKYVAVDDEFSPLQISLESKTNIKMFGKKMKETKFGFDIGKSGIKEFTIEKNGQKSVARCIEN